MKLKTSTILVVLVIMLTPFYESVQATKYTIEISQSPWTENVRAGDIITITVTINPEDDKYEIYDTWYSPTEVRWERNGDRQPDLRCNEILPARLTKVTFTLGPFIAGDLIRYSVHIGFNDAVDYHSSIIFFTVFPEDLPRTFEGLPSWAIYTIIGVGVLALIVALYFFRRSKKK